MMKRLPIFKIVLGNSKGIQKMSLVEFPAVESDFIAFEKQEEPMTFSYDEEQHIVFGCSLRADYPIYRKNERFGEFYVTFTKDTIKQLYERFMMEGRVSEVNLQHEKNADGVYLIQSFLKDTERGINPVGFEDIADGSWFTAYKIDNEEVWQRVKDGMFNGFSVEGYFEIEPFEKKDEIEELIDELLK